MRNFLITGLPRSRTAWMAAFMECDHEPRFNLESREDIAEYFSKNQGCSDHGLGFWAKYIVEDLKVRTVIIDRPIDEVEASLETLGLDFPKNNYCDVLLDKLSEVREHPLVMCVPFKALNEIRVMQKVFWHLRPGVAFDEERFNLMKNIIIEVTQLEIKEMVNLPIDKLMSDEIIPLLKIKGN